MKIQNYLMDLWQLCVHEVRKHNMKSEYHKGLKITKCVILSSSSTMPLLVHFQHHLNSLEVV